jgi:hypothetical protein
MKSLPHPGDWFGSKIGSETEDMPDRRGCD